MSLANTTICFVGDNDTASARYRVNHHIEQAIYQGAMTHYLDLSALGYNTKLPQCDILYLHRVPLTSRTISLIIQSRHKKIPIVFDTDDLVWDQREREYNFLDQHYATNTVKQILKTTRRLYWMMHLANTIVVSTDYLSEQARKIFQQPIFVNMNAVSDDLVNLSDSALCNIRNLTDDKCIIGYFSGHARVHDEDVAGISTTLCTILNRYKSVQLRIFGNLQLKGCLLHEDFAKRIERFDAVEWRELQHAIAEVDINIAPILDNPQRRSKSAVKYLEAALVGVPTVASKLEPYLLINHNNTGMLAESEEEWLAFLTELIINKQKRIRLGSAARADVLNNHLTYIRSSNFGRIIQNVIMRSSS